MAPPVEAGVGGDGRVACGAGPPLLNATCAAWSARVSRRRVRGGVKPNRRIHSQPRASATGRPARSPIQTATLRQVHSSPSGAGSARMARSASCCVLLCRQRRGAAGVGVAVAQPGWPALPVAPRHLAHPVRRGTGNAAHLGRRGAVRRSAGRRRPRVAGAAVAPFQFGQGKVRGDDQLTCPPGLHPKLL
jgi:hypothetical protein